jgi:hypothetical protein
MAPERRRPRRHSETVNPNPFVSKHIERIRRPVPNFDRMRGVEALDLEPRLKLLLLAIARACDETGECTRLGRAHLAVATGATEDHVSRLTQKAVKAGLLLSRGRGTREGRLRNSYVLLVEPLPNNDDVLQNALQGPVSANRHLAGSNPTSGPQQTGMSASANPPLEVARVTVESHRPESPSSNHPAPVSEATAEEETAPCRSPASETNGSTDSQLYSLQVQNDLQMPVSTLVDLTRARHMPGAELLLRYSPGALDAAGFDVWPDGTVAASPLGWRGPRGTVA